MGAIRYIHGDLWGSAPNPDEGFMGRCPNPHLRPFYKRVLGIPKIFEKMFVGADSCRLRRSARDIGETDDISDSRDACPYKEISFLRRGDHWSSATSVKWRYLREDALSVGFAATSPKGGGLSRLSLRESSREAGERGTP